MQLKISDIVIPLDAATSLPLVMRSPLFLDDNGRIPGSYVFNITVPAGEAIRQVYSQAHRPQRNGRATAELPYTLVDGSLRYSGKCLVTEANKDAYQVSLKVDYPELGGKTLKGLDLGGDRSITDLLSTAHMAALANYNQSDPEYLEIPLYVPDEILSDLTSSLTDQGRTFTAPDTMNCTLTIRVLAWIILGSIHVLIKKNGTLVDEDYYNSGREAGTTEVSLSLTAGDVITVEVNSESESSTEGYTCYFGLNDFAVEYAGVNVFTTTAALDQDTSDFAIFPIHNQAFLDNFPDDKFQLDNLSIKTIYTEYFKVQNYWKNGEFPLYLSGMVEGEPIYCANLFTPMVYMRKLLDLIGSESGYSIVNNPFDTEDFKNMVLFNAYAENNYTSTSTTLLPLKPTFNLVDHVPEMLQSDFLREISKLTGYMPVTDNDAMTITFVDLKEKTVVSNTNPAASFPGILLANPTVKVEPEYKGIKFELTKATTDKYLENIKDLSSKFNYKGELDNLGVLFSIPITGIKVNDMYYIVSNNSYYVFQYDTETYELSWVFFAVKHSLKYTDGNDPFLTLTSVFSPVLTKNMADEIPGAPDNKWWTIPITEQPGILEGFPDSLGAEYGLQVLYYKGMVNDSLDEPYPLGSSRCADYTGLTFPDLSATGLVDNRYRNWLEWLAYNAKPVTYKAIMNRAQLKQLQFAQVYSGNNVNFLVKEVRANLKMDGPGMVEVDVYTV